MAAPNIIELVRARFANVKQLSAALSGVGHKGLRGRFREILAESLLTPFLPPTVEMRTGTIVGFNGDERKTRNEDDVVLFDRTAAPLLHHTVGRDAIMPITGVRAHIEVKSSLRLDEIRPALEAAAELIKLSGIAAPVGILFAFDSEIGKDHHIPDLLLSELKQTGYQPNPGQTTCPIQAVCTLGRGTWILMREIPKAGITKPGWYEVAADEDHALLAFISVISNTIFGNDQGVGSHILDPKWMRGPEPECDVVVPRLEAAANFVVLISAVLLL